MKYLFVLITMIVLIALSGCTTTYHAERQAEDGSYTKIDVSSWREFPGGIKIKYNRESGAFELNAGEVTSGSDAEIIRDILISILPAVSPREPPRE